MRIPRIWMVLCVLLAIPTSFATAGTLTGGQLGPYRYYIYQPANHDPKVALPLVVVLHGCKQNAADISTGTGFNALADEARFIVLYPETRSAPNNPLGCWMWWEPDNQRRGFGEPALIINMVNLAQQRIKIDTERVYVTGMSSGGALSAILASIYPDVFAAAGIHSGLEFGAAASANCALSAMRDGGPNPEGRGEIAYHSQGTHHRIVPIIVFHGTDDRSVKVANAEQLVQQFTQANDYADDADGNNESFDAIADGSANETASGGYPYIIENFESADGDVMLKKVLVEGLGHAWSGGNPAGSYTDPKGPDASRMMWTFFQQWTLQAPAIQKHPLASCREKLATNHSHFWWHRTMGVGEYSCDPWRTTWRHSFGKAWSAGRCP